MTLDFIGKRNIWFALSLLVILPGLVSMIVQGFNLGIDFTGGTILDLKFARPVTVGEVREVLKEFGLENSTIQLSTAAGGNQGVLIRTKVLTEDERRNVLAALGEKIGAFDVLRVEKVGAVIGKELTRAALWAVAIASVGMIIYITFRFEFKFAIAGIIALLHDVLVVLGAFSLFRIEVDSSFVAAILTILGYSINDTIVIFDRIRENLKTHKKSESFKDLVNRSIMQTLTRSIYTVLTVLFATLALFIFGGDTTKPFALALLIGFASGAYSSIFNASPLWVVFKEWEQARRGMARAKAK